MEDNTDFIATELLRELKEGNARKDVQILKMHQNQIKIIYSFMIAILIIVAGFLLYLNQYDFISTEEYIYEATGIHAIIDSEGNVIAEDLTPEDINKILEVLMRNGDGKENRKENIHED